MSTTPSRAAFLKALRNFEKVALAFDLLGATELGDAERAVIAEYDASQGASEPSEPNYDRAQREFHRVTSYWAPEWVNDPSMFAKMLDSVLAAALSTD